MIQLLKFRVNWHIRFLNISLSGIFWSRTSCVVRTRRSIRSPSLRWTGWSLRSVRCASSRVSSSPTRKSAPTSKWTCTGCPPTPSGRSSGQDWFPPTDSTPFTTRNHLSSGKWVCFLKSRFIYTMWGTETSFFYEHKKVRLINKVHFMLMK